MQQFWFNKLLRYMLHLISKTICGQWRRGRFSRLIASFSLLFTHVSSCSLSLSSTSDWIFVHIFLILKQQLWFHQVWLNFEINLLAILFEFSGAILFTSSCVFEITLIIRKLEAVRIGRTYVGGVAPLLSPGPRRVMPTLFILVSLL